MNTFQMSGFVITEPEVKQVGEVKVATMRVAVRNAGDRTVTGTGQERQDGIFTLEAWGKTAEFVEQHVKKGSCILSSGRYKLSRWEDKDTQQKREKVQFTADNIEFSPGSGNRQNTDHETAPSQEAVAATSDGF